MNGTAEERTAALDAMEPELRGKILAALPDNVAEYTPKYKDEAEKARKALQEERQAQIRKRNPPLQDLLQPRRNGGCALRREGPGNGDRSRKLDPAKRADVVAMLPPKSAGILSRNTGGKRRCGERRSSPPART